MKRISTGLLVAFVLLAGNAHAGELTLKTTEKYYAVMNLKGAMAHMIELATNQMLASTQFYFSQDMKKRGMTEGDIKIALSVIRTNVMDLRNVMLANLDQLLPVKQIMSEIYYPVLKKHFSEEEILDLIKFYQTPLGKKTIEEMPAIMNESGKLLNQSQYVPRLQKFVAGEMEKRRDVVKKEIEKEIAKTREKKNPDK
ncbi:MAG: DUF2059 domain-containing protein [Syntrophaceae bacterium]